MTTIILISKIFLSLSFIFILIRLIRGPHTLDRILSMDALSVCVMAVLIVKSVEWSSPHFIDLILVFSLLNFIGTLSFCFYLSRKNMEGQ